VGAERKQIAVPFANLSGFTALTERLNPKVTRLIIAHFLTRRGDLRAP
jgi:hypothetical protein